MLIYLEFVIIVGYFRRVIICPLNSLFWMMAEHEPDIILKLTEKHFGSLSFGEKLF